ncbi:hypothetical protein NSS71_08075 [Niallia sp. FSL W8-0951]|uniref:hypothetical protein n=1 Tax=Niallia sp. FSL W8-0951 TaxID=2954639 RepID=UPI0030FB3153
MKASFYEYKLVTKIVYGNYENCGKPEQKYNDVDVNINKFIAEEGIEPADLIDIKYAHGEGQSEGSALIIYRK